MDKLLILFFQQIQAVHIQMGGRALWAPPRNPSLFFPFVTEESSLIFPFFSEEESSLIFLLVTEESSLIFPFFSEDKAA